MTAEMRALLWAFDRLSVDNPTRKEIKDTVREIGKVILGRDSVAARYQPNDWDDSAKLSASRY